MSHVDDRWYVTRDGGKVPTARHGRGHRWQATWIADGKERTKSFGRKVDAEAHLTTVGADLLRGTYIDPAEGRTTFRKYAEQWRANAVHDLATQARVERTLRLHVYPVLGERPIGAVRTSGVQAFVSAASRVLAPSTLRVAYSVVRSIFAAAVRDRVIPASPCDGVQLPEVRSRKVQPPSLDVVDRLTDLLPQRHRAVVDLVCGSGLRQGEVFGLEVVHLDFLRGRHLDVVQQLKTLARQRFLCRPKTKESERAIPLAQVTLDALAAHLAAFPVGEVEVEDRLDPRKPHMRPARLVFTLDDGGSIARHDWSPIWVPAARAVGMAPREGLHMLRHLYASLLIRHGADVKQVQARLGHSSAVITLDLYGHLWPDSDDRTRDAVSAALGARTDRPRTETGP